MARILIVEDEATVRKTLIHVLMLKGHLVMGTGNGPQALAMNGDLKPDLVFVDIKLPGLSGFEVIQKLQQGVHVPRIVAMAGMGRSVLDLAENLGADASLEKPFGIQELLDIVALQAA